MVEDDLKPLLGQIDGVAAVEVNGGQVRELQVNLDPRRLEALNLPITEVAAKLAADNLDVPGGQVRRDGKAVSLRTQGQYKTASEIENVILRSDGGSTVRVKDVGEVVDGFEDRVSTTRLNGEDAVSFSVRKQSGANTRRRAAQARRGAGQGGAELPAAADQDGAHRRRRHHRERRPTCAMHIIFGGIMAVLVVFVFMRDWRSTLITALALPTSVIATFFFMYAIGFTINMMTLMALSLVIGILIDDAVVVRESIYRHMEHGEDPVTAARNGTSEIGLAVMATTFTILAVFLPVGFMTGIVGQFFKSFALTIAFAVSISLLVAFTLDPMLSSRFVRFIPLEERTRTRTGRFLERVGGFYDRIDVAVSRAARLGARASVEDRRDRRGGVLREPVDAVGDRHRVRAAGRSRRVRRSTSKCRRAPRSSRPSRTSTRSRRSSRACRKCGRSSRRSASKAARSRRRCASRPARSTSASAASTQLKEDIRARLKQIPLLKMTVADPEFMQGAPTQAPLSVYLRGDDMAELQRLNEEVVAEGEGRARRRRRRQHARNRPARNGRPSVNREHGRRSRLRRRLGGDAAARHGRRHRADAAARRRQGVRHPRPARAGVPQRLRGDRADAALLADRRRGARARHRPAAIPRSARRRSSAKQRRRQAKINIELSDRSLGEVTADVGKVMAGITLPPNFEWGFAGDVEMMQESAAAMGLALLLAMAFIYIVLASQFESFLEPFLIMISLPLALVGALLAILLTGKNLGMPAMIGVVMLMGLVTKNAILLVDLTNQYVREGLSVKDAILKAGPVRLRPILMTTIAMILGMLPSAMGTRRRQRVPLADLDRDDRRPDHLDAADAGGRAGGVPAAGARASSASRRWRSTPARVPQAVRVAGVVLLVAAARLAALGDDARSRRPRQRRCRDGDGEPGRRRSCR